MGSIPVGRLSPTLLTLGGFGVLVGLGIEVMNTGALQSAIVTFARRTDLKRGKGDDLLLERPARGNFDDA